MAVGRLHGMALNQQRTWDELSIHDRCEGVSSRVVCCGKGGLRLYGIPTYESGVTDIA